VEFHDSVKNRDQELLAHLDEYENSVLVSGCHRSGTTALTDLLNRTDGFADYTFGHDSELDGALLLAGCVERFTSGRHCFQTTYLNDRFPEYFLHESFRLIWVLREPRSVVYSMLHNWERGALNRLYEVCGRRRLQEPRDESVFGRWIGPARIDKACASYVATIEQAFALHSRLGDRMLVIDYQELVTQPEATLSRVCAFAEVPFQPSMPSVFHGRSVRRGDRLARWQATRVDEVCSNFYHAAWSLGPACRLHNA
jgi:hypothetical protein